MFIFKVRHFDDGRISEHCDEKPQTHEQILNMLGYSLDEYVVIEDKFENFFSIVRKEIRVDVLNDVIVMIPGCTVADCLDCLKVFKVIVSAKEQIFVNDEKATLETVLNADSSIRIKPIIPEARVQIKSELDSDEEFSETIVKGSPGMKVVLVQDAFGEDYVCNSIFVNDKLATPNDIIKDGDKIEARKKEFPKVTVEVFSFQPSFYIEEEVDGGTTFLEFEARFKESCMFPIHRLHWNCALDNSALGAERAPIFNGCVATVLPRNYIVVRAGCNLDHLSVYYVRQGTPVYELCQEIQSAPYVNAKLVDHLYLLQDGDVLTFEKNSGS